MAKKTAAQRKRLTPEQKQDILDNKDKVSGAELAKKHGVAIATIYNTWSKAKKKAGKAPVLKGKAKKSENPNQNRIDFCKRWIGLLQAEVKRLENDQGFLTQAEAVLSKIIGQ